MLRRILRAIAMAVVIKPWRWCMVRVWQRRLASLMAKEECGELKGNRWGWPVFAASKRSGCLSLVGPMPWTIAVNPETWDSSREMIPDRSTKLSVLVKDYRERVISDDPETLAFRRQIGLKSWTPEDYPELSPLTRPSDL